LKLPDSTLLWNDETGSRTPIRGRKGEAAVKPHSSTPRKIVIATYGSRGDVQPLLALALALRKRGHEASLAGPPEYAEWVESYGCGYRPFGTNFKDFARTFPDVHSVRAAVLMVRFLRRETKLHFKQLPEVIQGADMVLGASLTFGLATVAEAMDIPHRFVTFCPQLLRSAHHPPIVAPNHNLPRIVNRLLWRLASLFDVFNGRAIINRERKRLGLKTIDDFWDYLMGDPVIVASDPVLGSPPDDVKQRWFQTGYFHLAQNGDIDRDLEAFLQSGPPPVYIGFGSMPNSSPEKLAGLLRGVVGASNNRFIIAKGWTNLHFPVTSKNVFVLNGAPHDRLFPRTAAVVHHGGSGTTATAARAGTPQIVVPHALDQFYWANRIRSLGLGPDPIPRFRLTAGRLRKAIAECVGNDAMMRNARDVAAGLAGCDSLGNVVRLIESELSNRDRAVPRG
jgi:UDP:flavonoid glycosyltransferase YjiC (YdhE family)